ncbi:MULTISPECIES: hypothetical protein [Clostridium]|uniref:PTS sugar transporter subunit IIA domain-containing protein n=1 Tax=Clostridium TaxID=1485 RepID=UPI000826F716|nr:MULTISPECIES: hypothetical protein [Clostridium]PJI09217.1 PTS fructose transporter subunit IIA [Clostridium sp. CT7]
MKNILIISGHGKYATMIKSSIEFLAGGSDEIEYIDFTDKDTDITLKEKMKKVLVKYENDNVLFVCDILGGTPFKCAVELSIGKDSIEVTAGCNVSSIIESIFQKNSMSISELADFIIESSKNSTGKFVMKKEVRTDNSEGI